MSTITKEQIEQYANAARLIQVSDFDKGKLITVAPDHMLELARNALASLEAEPVGEVSEQRDGLVMDGTVDLGGASTHRIIKGASKMKRLPLGTKFYTTPPAPANAEPVAWLWSHRKHPSEVSIVRPEDDERAEGAHWSGWSCQALYAAPPAPVSVPDALEDDIHSDDHPLLWSYNNGWNACRSAMLQGADGTLTNEGTIPVTQFNPVADLYGLTSPTGGETSFTFDAVEARDFIDGGWSCQEYVELGRFQEAVSGKSPVVPDGWVACSEQMPEDEQEVIVQNKMGYRYVSYFDEHSGLFFDMRGGNQMNCIEHIFVTHWMPLPAAPQQEVESQIRKGKTVAREEWELGARLTKHRFKP